MGSADGLCDCRADVNNTQLGALPIVSSSNTEIAIIEDEAKCRRQISIKQTYTLHLVAQWYSICHNQGGKDTAVQCLNSGPREDPMRD